MESDKPKIDLNSIDVSQEGAVIPVLQFALESLNLVHIHALSSMNDAVDI